jgi:hypothetical protein
MTLDKYGFKWFFMRIVCAAGLWTILIRLYCQLWDVGCELSNEFDRKRDAAGLGPYGMIENWSLLFFDEKLHSDIKSLVQIFNFSQLLDFEHQCGAQWHNKFSYGLTVTPVSHSPISLTAPQNIFGFPWIHEVLRSLLGDICGVSKLAVLAYSVRE